MDVLRHVQWPIFFSYYKLDVLRLFYRAHIESLLDITYENINRNRVGTYFIRDQNRLLVPRHESRYMKDSLSYRGASLWNFVNYNDKEASATLNFNLFRKRVSSEDYFIDFKFECTSWLDLGRVRALQRALRRNPVLLQRYQMFYGNILFTT